MQYVRRRFEKEGADSSFSRLQAEHSNYDTDSINRGVAWGVAEEQNPCDACDI